MHKVISGDDILRLQHLVREVPISDDLIEFVSNVVRATRPETTTNSYVKEWVNWGAGPRASQNLILAAKANAAFNGKFSPDIEDVKAVAIGILRHRIIKNYKADAEGITEEMIIEKLI